MVTPSQPARFEFAGPGRIVFGRGVAAQLPALAKGLGRRAFVVTGRDPERARKLVSTMSDGGEEPVFYSAAKEPDLEMIREATAKARDSRCDFVLAIGGGSALDTGKAAAVMMTNPGEVLDYLEVIGRGKTIAAAPAPVIAVPTTAGTGSEATRNAVIGSPQHKVKASLRTPMMLPRVAVVDPELTVGVPPSVTASTGMDALTQLIEPYVCLRANPMVDGWCLEGMRRVARSLRSAFGNGEDLVAREDMALASLFGGLALSNAGLGAVHGLANPIGGMFAAPHGAICAALLPHIMGANIRAMRSREPQNPALGRYAEIARILTGNDGAEAEQGIEWAGKLVEDLGSAALGSFGLDSKAVGQIAEQSQKSSSMKANPIALTTEELAAAVNAAGT